MKTHRKLIQILITLALLTGAIAFTTGFPGFEDNVAWNSRMAWQSGGSLPMPNVAWNSGVAWVPDLDPANVAWNSGVAYYDGGGQFVIDDLVNCGDFIVPGVLPLSVAWNS